MKLTPKQKAFADNYIENGGNASAAARDAGYRERAAGSMGAENLKKPQIAAYIAERQEKIDSDRICTLKEIQVCLNFIILKTAALLLECCRDGRDSSS